MILFKLNHSCINLESFVEIVDDLAFALHSFHVQRVLDENVSALRLRNFAIASSAEAIVFTDLDMNLSYVNARFLSMWGYEEEREVPGRLAPYVST